MKSVILAACLMVASVVSTVTATEFCSAGQILTNTTIALDTPGATHTISTGCSIADELNIRIDASMNVGTTADAATTVTINQVLLGRRDVLIVVGSSSEVAKVRSPYILNILNNRFGDDSSIFFTGALPPNSIVTVSGNRFNASTPLGLRIPSPFTSVSTWAACIIVYDMTLFDAKVFVTQNQIFGSDVVGNYNIIGVYVYTQIFFMSDGAQFSVTKNNITSICNPLALNGICGYGVMANSLYIYASGAFNIDDNTFNSAGCLITNMPNIINPSLTPEANGKITFSGNRGVINTMYLPHEGVSPNLQPFMMFNSINVKQHTAIEVLGNSFDVTGTNGMFAFIGDFNFFENTTLTIGNNRLVTRDCTPGIYFEEHSTEDTARIRVLNNDFYRDDDTNIDLPLLYFGKSFGLKSTATLTVAYNKFGGRAVPSTAMLVDLAAAAVNAFTFANDARLYACGNVLGGKALLAASAVWPALHNALRARVLVTGCAGTPLATNISVATTTAARTTARSGITTTAFPIPTTNGNATNPPLGNHVAGRIADASLIAALCVLVCALLH